MVVEGTIDEHRVVVAAEFVVAAAGEGIGAGAAELLPEPVEVASRCWSTSCWGYQPDAISGKSCLEGVLVRLAQEGFLSRPLQRPPMTNQSHNGEPKRPPSPQKLWSFMRRA